MIITPRDEAQIAFYFRAQDRFERSTSGPMLERADRLGVDSEGRRLAAACDNWNWREPVRDEDSGVYSRYGDDQQRQVHELQLGGGYEPDHAALVAFAQASRRMLAVERVSLRSKMALEAYYGDRGYLWSNHSQREGGPGAIVALFILTDEGQAFVARERTRSKQAPIHLTDDELLANVFVVQRMRPDASRRARLTKVQDAAETLLRGAWVVWSQTAPERRRRAVA
jgi:hypothetical protein